MPFRSLLASEAQQIATRSSGSFRPTETDMPRPVHCGSTDLKGVSHVSLEVKICFKQTGRQKSIAHFLPFATNLAAHLFFLSFQLLKLVAYSKLCLLKAFLAQGFKKPKLKLVVLGLVISWSDSQPHSTLNRAYFCNPWAWQYKDKQQHATALSRGWGFSFTAALEVGGGKCFSLKLYTGKYNYPASQAVRRSWGRCEQYYEVGTCSV